VDACAGVVHRPCARALGRIDFDKNTQRFDRTAAHRLLNLAHRHGDAHMPVGEDRPETLTGNLLRVTAPKTIDHAPIDTQDRPVAGSVKNLVGEARVVR
jgi:hypothetical protein